MPIVLSNLKKPLLLEKERVYLNTLQIRLFVNNYTPVAGMTAANFTAPTDTGYFPVTNVGFAPAILNGSNQAETLAPPLSWTFNFDVGTFTVYGYVMIDPADGVPVYAERATSPFTVTGAGQTYTINPRKQMDTM